MTDEDKKTVPKLPRIPYGTIALVTDQRLIYFYNKAGKKVGELDFSTGQILFEGAMDESSNAFFSLLKDAINPFLTK